MAEDVMEHLTVSELRGEKFGLSVTPIATQAGATQAAAPAGGTGQTAGAYDTAAHRDDLINLVNEIRQCLIDVGIIKGSA